MRKRKVGILLAALAIPFLALSQSRTNRLIELYNYVDKTDSLTGKSQRTFYLEKFLKDDYKYRETWHYAMNDGKISFFQVDFIVDSTEFTEVYYVNRGDLVCSEEYEKINYSLVEDELRRGGVFYFNGVVPQHMVMIGQEVRENRHAMSPEVAVLQRFEKRYTELKRHLPMLP